MTIRFRSIRDRGKAQVIISYLDRRRSTIGKSFDTQRADLSVARETAVLVSVALPERPWLTSDPCDELRGLAGTAGATVVAELTQKRQEVVPATYIGKGKMDELKAAADAADVDVVLFDNDLSPA